MKNPIKYLKSSYLWRNSIITGILKPLSMLLSYLYVPIVLHYLGEELYGAWATILSILSWISYFDIGIGNGLRNKLTESITLNQKDRSRKLISSAYLMLAIVVFVVGTIMIIVALFLDWNNVLGLRNKYGEIKLVVVLSLLFVCINFILSLCRTVMLAMQKAAFASLVDFCNQFFALIGIIIVSAFSSENLFLVSIISGGASVVSCLLFSIIFYSFHREFIPSFHLADRNTGKEVTSLGIQFFVIQVCGLILFTTDNLIISNLYGAENVTPYSIVNKLFTAVISLHAAVLTPFWSAMTKAYVEKELNEIKKIIRYGILIMIPFIFVGIVISLLFKPLTVLWLGEDLNCSKLLVLFGTIYCIVYLWCNTFGILSSGMNIVKGPMYIAIIQAIFNVPLSLLLAVKMKMGPEGILLGTIISMLISAVAVPIILMKRIHKKDN